MTPTPTRAERDEMRALLAKATPGPWRLEPPSTGFPGYIVQGAEWSGEVATVQADPGRAQCLANAQAIEILRNRAEALLDELDRAEATIARLTAEVTEEECIAARVAANPYARDGDGMQSALSSFLASRKGGRVEGEETGNG